MIFVKTYNEPEFNIKEILRYSGARDMEGLYELVEDAISQAKEVLTYKVCYGEFPVSINDDEVMLPSLRIKSKALAKNLSSCEKILIFGATVGIGIDRLIAKYGGLSPAKALILQGIGAERIEALCDTFCSDMKKEYGKIKPRFSPGYGDLDISVQKDIFRLLDCHRKIGLTLNESLLMSPSKSVTAIVGIGECEKEEKSGCETCTKTNCEFRKKRKMNYENN